jgi:hypothetical protein
MKIGPEGKKAILEQVQFHLNMERSGMPRQGIEHVLTQWIVALLESSDSTELKAELEK